VARPEGAVGALPGAVAFVAAMRVLVAPDKFKGTFTAGQIADALARGLAGVEADLCPIADGGDGTASVLVRALGGEWVEAASRDALGRPIKARYVMLSDEVAVVEVSEASGLSRLAELERDPLGATSVGTGELIADAIGRGADRVLVAVGGSATTDAGLGALSAFDPGRTEIVCLCDVSDPFEGALRYAPQKGAGPEELSLLRRRLTEAASRLPKDPRGVPRAGAAGGLAGGFWAHGASLVSGARFVLDCVGFDRRLARADLVITGEGRLDESSLRGKAVAEVARRSHAAGVPAHAVVGANAASRSVVEKLGLRSVCEASDPNTMAACARRIVFDGG